MKQLISIFILLLLPFISFAQEDPYKNIKYEKLQNGLKVYILSDKLAQTTQIEVNVAVGSDVEDEQNSGIAHLTEHLVFRDQRIPHKDYLDYIKEEGATYINGGTQRYQTQYLATIDSEKSYWLVETFSQMLFDKEVTQEDLEIEKRALQTEIGELQAYEYYINKLVKMFKFLAKLFPDIKEYYLKDFSIEEEKDLPAQYYSKRNNYNFTLEEVMKFYEEYYYPKNMTLKVVGNFDSQKMMSLIKKKYGVIKKVGTKKAQNLKYDAVLSKEPYLTIHSGQNTKNYAHIGTKFILDDYKQYLILDSYTSNLANVMQQHLRNKLGQTYSVSQYYNGIRNAAVIGVTFTSLHEEFANNLYEIKKKIEEDKKQIPRKEIEESLKASELYYSTLEHDSDTLLSLVSTKEYLQKYQHIYDKTPYEVFKSISIEEFQKVITQSFTKENKYEVVSHDYYLFPLDIMVISVLLIILQIFVYFKAYKFFNKNLYSIREIKFSRRLTNRFFSFLNFMLLSILSSFIIIWIEYIVSKYILGNVYYFDLLSQANLYIYFILSFLISIVIFILLQKIVFKSFFVRLDITQNNLNLLGGVVKSIEKNKIKDVQVVSYSISNFYKITGWYFLFYKPLVAVTISDSKTIYLRAQNAAELADDLLDWIKEK